MSAEWDDLTDSELVARLVNRGVDPDDARAMVRQRDCSGFVRRTITEILAA